MKKSALISLLVLISCVGPDNDTKYIEVTPDWHNQQINDKLIKVSEEQQSYQAEWWKNFNDDVLNGLVQQAIANNLDLKLAEARIKEARASQTKAEAMLLPSIGISSTASSTTSNLPKRSSSAVNTATNGLSASWELDFFGVNSNMAESERQQLLGVIANRNHVLAVLVADAALNYIAYRQYQNLISINKNSMQLQKDIAGIVKSKEVGGLSDESQVIQADAEYINAQAADYGLQSQLSQAQYTIETLCGVSVGSFEELLAEVRPIPMIKTQIIASLPLQVVQNRPDIIVVEKNLMSAVALTRSALATQFPKISLSAFFGYQNSNYYPSQKLWTIGQSAMMPLINFGAIKAQIDVQKAQEEQAFINYQNVVLKALQEIETDFVQYVSNYKNYMKLSKLLANSKRSLHLSEQLYKSSLTSGIELLNSKQQVWSTAAQATTTLANLSRSAVLLYKALGYTVPNI